MPIKLGKRDDLAVLCCGCDFRSELVEKSRTHGWKGVVRGIPECLQLSTVTRLLSKRINTVITKINYTVTN